MVGIVFVKCLLDLCLDLCKTWTCEKPWGDMMCGWRGYNPSINNNNLTNIDQPVRDFQVVTWACGNNFSVHPAWLLLASGKQVGGFRQSWSTFFLCRVVQTHISYHFWVWCISGLSYLLYRWFQCLVTHFMSSFVPTSCRDNCPSWQVGLFDPTICIDFSCSSLIFKGGTRLRQCPGQWL